MIRVCLDTNLWVSAALQPSGIVARLIDHLVESGATLVCSPFICREFTRVLQRLEFPANGIPSARQAILDVADRVDPSAHIDVITADPTDNRILECAVEGRAQVLITGDLRHLRPLGSFQGIDIMTPRGFTDKYFPTR